VAVAKGFDEEGGGERAVAVRVAKGRWRCGRRTTGGGAKDNRWRFSHIFKFLQF
jgi:hypothetical protein